jgi:hypothetical protein
VLIGTHTANVMDATARRVENGFKKIMPAHNWEGRTTNARARLGLGGGRV